MSGSENMKPQAKTVTPSTSTAQQVLPDEGYNCLSQVTVNKIPYTESDNAAGGKTVTIGEGGRLNGLQEGRLRRQGPCGSDL